MILLGGIITVAYYLIVAGIVVVLTRNLIRSKHWEQEVLYIVVLIPFLLRLFRLK